VRPNCHRARPPRRPNADPGLIPIVREDWWHQLCHGWTHYAGCVPWMWLLQGKKRTRYAAAWTLVNAQ
jgi:hypothetical protein